MPPHYVSGCGHTHTYIYVTTTTQFTENNTVGSMLALYGSTKQAYGELVIISQFFAPSVFFGVKNGLFGLILAEHHQ